MVRTQIQLTEEQSRRLKEIAAAEGVSVAEIIRRSVDRYVGTSLRPSLDELRDRARSIAGQFTSDQTDVSSNHDKYLAEAYGDWDW
jgi:hypothetical protein